MSESALEKAISNRLKLIGSKIRQDEKLENWQKSPLVFESKEEMLNCNCPDPSLCEAKGWKFLDVENKRFASKCKKYEEFEKREASRKRIKASLPEKFRGLGFKDFDETRSEQTKEAYDACRRFYLNKLFLKGSGITLSGGYGTGKSHLASAVIHNCMIDNYSAGFVTASSLNRGGFDDIEKRFEAMKQCDVVVIDDLATETDNQLILRHLFDFINYRYEVKKSVIITTNFNLDLFRESVGDRIYDRLEERNKWVEIKDVGSYRKNITKYTDW